MRRESPELAPLVTPEPQPADRWQTPTVEVVCLACEISAYAPDGDLPLF